MQPDAVAIAALRPRLEKLAQLLERIEFSLPTDGRGDAEQARGAIIRTINEYLIPRLDEPEAPVVAAVIGATGSGKSTLVNSLANDRISDVGALRPTTRAPVLWAHRDHGGRYWAEFVARVRERVGATVEVVIGEDELTKELTIIDTPPSEYIAPSGRNPAVDALALADLCVFVTSPTRYADISAWDFLREIRWRGVPMLFVLNRLPPDREEAIALLNDFAARLHLNGLLLEPDAAMVFGVNEALGDRWHGGLEPTAVGALRNELGAVSNTGYRETLVAMTAYTAGRNVVDRSRLVMEEHTRAVTLSRELEAHVDRAYENQADVIATMIAGGSLRDMARHRSWSEAAVDLTAVVTRRAGVAAQETSRAWLQDDVGSLLLDGKGTSLWRHTEDTSWDVQGRLEEWQATLAEVAARHGRSGTMRPAAAKKVAAKSWRIVIDPDESASWSVRRRLGRNLSEYIVDAQQNLGALVVGALEVDASRFRQYLGAETEAAVEINRQLAAITALLHGEMPALESVPHTGPEDLDKGPATADVPIEETEDAAVDENETPEEMQPEPQDSTEPNDTEDSDVVETASSKESPDA